MKAKQQPPKRSRRVYGHPVGMLVVESPAEAARELRQLLVEHGTVSAVARVLGVHVRTARKWIRVLEAAGYKFPIPGAGNPAWKAGKTAAA